MADLIHVPNDDRAPPHRDSAVKLKPKPKTKHGSTDAALPEPSLPSTSLQSTTSSSLEDLPCKIVAGDLTLASHDYKSNPGHARRRPKKRPKPSKDTSEAISSTTTQPTGSPETTVPGPSSTDVPIPVSPPGVTVPQAASPAAADNAEIPERKPTIKVTGKDGDKKGGPKLKSKQHRAKGIAASKGTRSSRPSTSTRSARSTKATSSSSKQRTPPSTEPTEPTEIMDPDFRPDPAKRPRIVSPWLEPMPKDAERYMLLSFLALMHRRHRLHQPMLVDLNCPVLCASSAISSPRLTPQRDCPRLSALLPAVSMRRPASASSTLLEPRCHTEVCTSLGISSPVANRCVPRPLCLGKHLRIARFRQSLPRRRRCFRFGNVRRRSGPQPAWLPFIGKKLLSAHFFWQSLRFADTAHAQILSCPLPISFTDPTFRKHQSPFTPRTAVPGPKSGSNPPAGYKPKASSYLLLLYLSIFRSRGLEALSTDILLKPYTGDPSMQPLRRSRSVYLSTRPLTSKQSASAPYSGLYGDSIVQETPLIVAIASLFLSLMRYPIRPHRILGLIRTAVPNRASTS